MAGRYSDEFSELIAAQLPALTLGAYLLTGNRANADDLAQTTLTNACLAWQRVMSADSPEAYLRRILVNAHRKSFRRKRVVELLTGNLPERASREDGTDLRDDLLRAIAALPRRQRAVVVLRYVEDRPETEVADLLGCSIGTVKSQASRALATLRTHPALGSPRAMISEESRP